MWLTGRLAPDFKTIADFRRLNGAAICAACAQFIVICRSIGLFTRPLAVIDGSRFKGVNARDRNFTRGKVRGRLDKLNEAMARYLTALDAADHQEAIDGRSSGAGRLRDKLARLQAQMQKVRTLQAAVEAAPDKQVSFTDPDSRLMVGRGRDGSLQPPPAQIPACATNAPGSSLGFWRQSGATAAGAIS